MVGSVRAYDPIVERVCTDVNVDVPSLNEWYPNAAFEETMKVIRYRLINVFNGLCQMYKLTFALARVPGGAFIAGSYSLWWYVWCTRARL